MSPVPAACRICLAVDVRLLAIEGPLQLVYEKITNNTLHTTDGRPVSACYICHARLKKCRRLMLTSARAEKVLNDIFETYSEISEASISLVDCSHVQVLCGTLTVSVGESVSTLPPGSCMVEIKQESDDVNSSEEVGDHIEDIDPLDIWLDPLDLDTTDNIRSSQTETCNDSMDETDDPSGQPSTSQDRVMAEHTYAKRKRSARATLKQLQTIVAKIEAQPLLARKSVAGRETYNQAWKEVARDLNQMKMGAKKSPEQWILVWRDLKSRAFTKTAKLLRNKGAAGDLEDIAPLTKLERRVVSVVRTKRAVDSRSLESMIAEFGNDQMSQEDTETRATTQPVAATEETCNDSMDDTSDESERSKSQVVIQHTGAKRKRLARATLEQLHTLVAKIEAQPLMAKKRFGGIAGRETYNQAWKEVARELNKINSEAKKNPEQWITVWRDLKNRACAKSTKLLRNAGAAGDLAKDIAPLTELERRVVSIVRGKRAVDSRSLESMIAEFVNDMTQEDTETRATTQPVAATEETCNDSMDDTSDESERSKSQVVIQHTGAKRKRLARATLEQLHTLVAKIEAQPLMAKKRFGGIAGRETYNQAWKEVARELNKINSEAKKNPEQWITVWRDLKSRACAKSTKLLRNAGAAGDLAKDIAPLTELERRVVSIVRGKRDSRSLESMLAEFVNDMSQEDTETRATTQPVAATEETCNDSMDDTSDESERSKSQVVIQHTGAKRKRSARATLKQLEAILDRIEAQPFLIVKRFGGIAGRASYYQAWKEVARDLNKMKIGAKKNPVQWITVWRDLKWRACNKAAKLLRIKGANGDLEDIAPLTKLEMRVVSIVDASYAPLNSLIEESGNYMSQEDTETRATTQPVAATEETCNDSMDDTSDESERSKSQVVIQHTGAKRKRSARATLKQLQTLVAKIEAQPFMIVKRFGSIAGLKSYDQAWKEIARDLNKMKIGAKKNPEQWITVWRDLKSRACTKSTKLLRNKGTAGALAKNIAPLTELERRVVSVVRGKRAVDSRSLDYMLENSVNDMSQEDTETRATTQPVAATEDVPQLVHVTVSVVKDEDSGSDAHDNSLLKSLHTETRVEGELREDTASDQPSRSKRRNRAEANVSNRKPLPPLLHTSRKQTREGRHVCHVCQRSYEMKKSLKCHLMTHSGEKPYACNVCPFKFTNSSNLKRHSRTHTGEKPYECNVCQKRFVQMSTLKSHLLVHTREKPYECNVCQMRFTYKTSLRAHISNHTGGIPFECNVCRNLYSDKITLDNHLKSHTGEKHFERIKPHECYICQKLFRNMSILKSHLMTHTGEKPYECNVCQRRFRRKGVLVSHLRIHTR